MRKLFKILITIVVIVVILGIVILTQVNRIVRKSVETGTSYAFGVNTTLNSAKVGILRGQSSISGLNVPNPDGFKSDYFMNLGKANASLTLSSLFRSTIEVPSLSIDGIDINLEKRDGKANYDIIMANLAEFEKSMLKYTGKKFIIRELSVRNITVTVELLPIGGNLTRYTADIPEILLKDIGSDTNQGVLISELSGVVTKAVFASLVETGADLPSEILKDLGKGLQGLASVGKFGLKVVGKVTIKTIEIAGDVIKGVGKGVNDIGKGIRDILDKKQKDK